MNERNDLPLPASQGPLIEQLKQLPRVVPTDMTAEQHFSCNGEYVALAGVLALLRDGIPHPQTGERTEIGRVSDPGVPVPLGDPRVGLNQPASVPEPDIYFTDDLTALVREFIAYWTTDRAHGNSEVGCGMCGGTVHSSTCYVGRMAALLGMPLPSPPKWEA